MPSSDLSREDPHDVEIHQINLTKRQRHGIRALQLKHKSVKWIEYLLQSAATPGPGGGGDAGTGGTAGGGGGGGGRDGGSGQGSQMVSTFFSYAKQLLKHSFFQVLYDSYMGKLESRQDHLILAAGPSGRSSNRCGTGDDLEMVLDHAAERPEGRPRAAVRHDEVKGRRYDWYEGHL